MGGIPTGLKLSKSEHMPMSHHPSLLFSLALLLRKKKKKSQCFKVFILAFDRDRRSHQKRRYAHPSTKPFIPYPFQRRWSSRHCTLTRRLLLHHPTLPSPTAHPHPLPPILYPPPHPPPHFRINTPQKDTPPRETYKAGGHQQIVRC